MVPDDPEAYDSRIEWTGVITFHLVTGEEVVANRIVLATNGDFLDGEMPDYALWIEARLSEVRKLGIPATLLPAGPDETVVVLALEAPQDVLAALNMLGATADFDTLMADDRFLDLALGVERLTPYACHVTDSADSGVTA